MSSDTGKLTRILIGGALTPHALAHKLQAHGVFALQAWGMTEMSPIGTASTASPAAFDVHGADTSAFLWSRQGRAVFGVQVCIVGKDGTSQPCDGLSAGAVKARGPWVVQRYYRADSDLADSQGWFDTGDIAAVDELGYLHLTDRAKDIIKSGGEWISSIDVENVAASYPGVALAAVIGVPHPRWDERPLLIIQRQPGERLEQADLVAHLTPHMARWWLPERIILADVPLTSTGKIDKKLLRQRYARIFLEKGAALPGLEKGAALPGSV